MKPTDILLVAAIIAAGTFLGVFTSKKCGLMQETKPAQRQLTTAQSLARDLLQEFGHELESDWDGRYDGMSVVLNGKEYKSVEEFEEDYPSK